MRRGTCPDRLGGWDGSTVRRNDLLLIREDLPRLSIHEDLQPVDVVVAVFLMIAKRFDPSEVLKALPSGIQKWLIDTKIVRVSVHVVPRLFEGDDFSPQGQKELLEDIGLTVSLRERPGISRRSTSSVREIEAEICLRIEMIAVEWRIPVR